MLVTVPSVAAWTICVSPVGRTVAVAMTVTLYLMTGHWSVKRWWVVRPSNRAIPTFSASAQIDKRAIAGVLPEPNPQCGLTQL